MDFPHRIAQAKAEHGLAGVVENVDYLALRVFNVNALAIRQQVIFRTAADDGGKPFAELFLEKLHNPAHALKGKALAAQRADHRDFSYIVQRVEPPAAFPLRNDDVAFVPPLKLPRSNSRKPHDLR